VSRLLARLEQLRLSSTAPSTTDDDIHRIVAKAEASYATHAESARRAAQAIFDAKHREVKEAWGKRPLHGEIDSRKVGICRRSMELLGYSADRRTIIAHLEKMQTEFGMSPGCDAPVSTTSRST
jgi:hypothetical protein